MQIAQTEDGYRITEERGRHVREDERHIGCAISTLADALEHKEAGREEIYANFLDNAAEQLKRAAASAKADNTEARRMLFLPNRRALYASCKGMGILGAKLEEKVRRHESMGIGMSEDEEYAAQLNNGLTKLKEKFGIQAPIRDRREMYNDFIDFRNSILDLIAPGQIDNHETMFLVYQMLLELLPSSKFCLKKAGEGIERD